MRIFKKLILALLLVLLVFSFSSCHGSVGKTGFALPESFDTDKTYEISFWAKNDTNMSQVAVYENAIANFEKLYPNIKVKLRLYTDYTRIYNDVITNISTNTTPNVCITYPDHIATYMSGENVVVPLDNLFDDERYGLGGSELLFDSPKKEEVVEKFLDECVLLGEHYALPFMRSTEVCYVNKTYVEKLGYTLPNALTWDFVFEVARAAAEKGADGNYIVNGQKVMIPFIYKSTDNMMIQMLHQLDAGYSTEEGDILIFNEETRGILDRVAEATSCGSFSTFKISSYPANFLNAGQCIFAIDSTAGSTWMGSDAPLCDISEENLVDFEIAVMSLPQFDIENPKMISQGPSICIFNKEDSGEVLASWLFTQYMLTDEVQTAYAMTEGYVPVTTKAQACEEYVSYLSKGGQDNDLHYDVKIKASKLLIENTENTFVTPVFNGSASLRNAAGQLIENVTKSVRRKENIDDKYFEKLYSDVSSLYRLDQIEKGEGSDYKKDFGELPVASALLIVTLCVAWVGILTYLAVEKVKNIKKKS